MNLKTTIVLVLLVGAGAGGWFWLDTRKKPGEATSSVTLDFLKDKLTPEKLTRVEVKRRPKTLDESRHGASIFGLIATPFGNGLLFSSATLFQRTPTSLLVLEKKDSEWTLPGNWPVRPQETKEFVATLTSLHSRFAPIDRTASSELAPFGLDDDPLIIEATIDGVKHTLRFGEEPGAGNRFTRPTYLRLDSETEVIRLGAGVFAALDRKQEYFQKRRLFPLEREARNEKTAEKVDQLEASAVEVRTKNAKFTVVKKDKEWIMQEAQALAVVDFPFAKSFDLMTRTCAPDRIDPDVRDGFLRGFPELWAERFVDNKTLEECGLKDPETILTVTRIDGQKVTLWVGEVAETKTRFEPQPPRPGMPPMPPRFITEKLRYAKLADNEKLFVIKSEKLDEIAVDLDELRDPRLARFKTEDVTRLQLRAGDQEIILVKEKDAKDKLKWRFEKLNAYDVEAKAVQELLDLIEPLQTREQNIDDQIDAKSAGLEKPRGQIKVVVEEAEKTDRKDEDDKKVDAKDVKKKKREIVIYLGSKAPGVVKDKSVDNEDPKDFFKDKDPFKEKAKAKSKDKGLIHVRVDHWQRINLVSEDLWTLASRSELAYRPRELWQVEPDTITRITIQADSVPYHLDRVDKGWKISGPLEAEASPKDIDALVAELSHLQGERFESIQPKGPAHFGLDKPEFRITLAVKDGKPRVLEVGKRTADADASRYARIAGGDAVFVLSEKTFIPLRKDPFDFLDKALWTLDPAAIQRIRFQGVSKFALEVKNGQWKVIDAPAPSFAADDMGLRNSVAPLLDLRALKYAAFGGKIDLTPFGLDKPIATVSVTLADGPKDKTIERVLDIGKEAPGGGRYVRIHNKEAVAVLEAATVAALQPDYLDFVDPRVLKFDGDAVIAIERKMKDADLELTKREDTWLITKPGNRDADLLTIHDVLRKTSALQAKRIAAFPAKDLQPFGLDKPIAVVTVQIDIAGNATKHVIKIGSLTKDAGKKDTDERFAMIDDRPIVIVLSAELSRHLLASALYFADRNLASFSNIDRAELTTEARKAVFTRGDTGWKMTQPIDAAADGAALDDMIRSLQRLRADEIVAEKATDLKKFGLEKPLFQWRFKLGDTEHLHLLVGGFESDLPDARRYAKLGDKNVVFLLSNKVTAKLQKEIRNRAVWPAFPSTAASKLTVTQAGKAFTLERKDATWLLVGEPAVKINANAVTNTFAILESLKAVRYIVDAKADLKPFGLAEPAWKIEVELGKEKRELWLGGNEDKSPRLFATIAGSGVVFVVDEIDALILARPRAAYVEDDKKK